MKIINFYKKFFQRFGKIKKYHKVFKKKKIVKIIIIITIGAALITAVLFLYTCTASLIAGKNNYFIENKYYGFKLKTPRDWIAEEYALYSEETISQFLTECKNNKLKEVGVYEIGLFRFKEGYKYPKNFSDLILNNSPVSFPTGVILEISVNCIPDGIKDKINNLTYSNFKIDGENVLEEFLDLPGFGKTRILSFLHNGFQYKIKEYIYISPSDKSNFEREEKLRKQYERICNEIISSFKFTK